MSENYCKLIYNIFHFISYFSNYILINLLREYPKSTPAPLVHYLNINTFI